MPILPAFSDAFAVPPVADERTCALAAAHALYAQRGLAAVSLADLAAHLGLPVAIVLQWFPSQELLVRAVVDALANLLYAALHGRHQESPSAVEELLARGNWASHEMQLGYATLFQQLETAFPTAWQRWQAHTTLPLDHLRNNRRRGVLQAFGQPSSEEEPQTERWLRQVQAAGFAAVVLPHTPVAELLAGIVTPAVKLAVQRLTESAI